MKRSLPAATVLAACLLALPAQAAAEAPANPPVTPRPLAFNFALFPPLEVAAAVDGPVVTRFGLNAIASHKYALDGLEVGGVYNAEEAFVHGLQVAGVANWNGGPLQGAQVSGVSNHSGGDVQGLQVSGVSNYAGGNLRGAQVGLVNMTAGRVVGTQIGLINTADALEGIPIGLISLVRDGRLEGQALYESNGITQVAINSGGKGAYSILSLQMRDLNAGPSLGAQMGVGFNHDLGGTFCEQVEFLGGSTMLSPGPQWELGSLATLRGSLGWQVAPHLSVKVGVSLNALSAKQLTHNPFSDAPLYASPTTQIYPGYFAALAF